MSKKMAMISHVFTKAHTVILSIYSIKHILNREKLLKEVNTIIDNISNKNEAAIYIHGKMNFATKVILTDILKPFFKVVVIYDFTMKRYVVTASKDKEYKVGDVLEK